MCAKVSSVFYFLSPKIFYEKKAQNKNIWHTCEMFLLCSSVTFWTHKK